MSFNKNLIKYGIFTVFLYYLVIGYSVLTNQKDFFIMGLLVVFPLYSIICAYIGYTRSNLKVELPLVNALLFAPSAIIIAEAVFIYMGIYFVFGVLGMAQGYVIKMIKTKA